MALLSIIPLLCALAAPATSAADRPVLDPNAPQERAEVIQVERAAQSQQLAWARRLIAPDTRPSQLGKRFTLSPRKPWIDGRGKLWFVDPAWVDPEQNFVDMLNFGGDGGGSGWISGRFVATADFVYMIDCVIAGSFSPTPDAMSVRVDFIEKNGSDRRELWRDGKVDVDGKHLLFTARPKKAGNVIFSFWSPEFASWRFHRCEITPIAK